MKKFVWPLFLFLIFAFSTGLLAYGWWLLRIEKGNLALSQGETETAAKLYEAAEGPFRRAPWLGQILRDDYQRLIFRQVHILYAKGKNDEAIEKLEQATATAPFLAQSGEYSFWTGNLLFRQAVQTKDPETSVNALKAALSEYQKGLAAEPDDWDLKYNYELVNYIFSQRERDKKKEQQKVKSILDKMRPVEPSREQLAPEKRG